MDQASSVSPPIQAWTDDLSASLALADLDRDGDLDLYCANYIDVMYTADPTTKYAWGESMAECASQVSMAERRQSHGYKIDSPSQPKVQLRELPEVDGLYLNDGKGHFHSNRGSQRDVQRSFGKARSSPSRLSLAVSFRDLNQDGWPDLYVCSDNATPDRLWLNDQQAFVQPDALRHQPIIHGRRCGRRESRRIG